MAEKPGREFAYPCKDVRPKGEYGAINYPGLTIRQYAAISLRVPEAEEEWLNDMIKRAWRLDYVKAAMQTIKEHNPDWVIAYADACLELEAKTQEEK